MATPARFLRLNAEQDEALREREVRPGVGAKVCLRASIIRLNKAGWSAAKLAKHCGRKLQSVHNDLGRFEQSGLEGLADGKAVGATPKVTPEMEMSMHTKLAEDRVWNSTLLSEASEQEFGVSVKWEAIRVKLLELGYSWKRTRYAASKQAGPKWSPNTRRR